MPNETRDPAKIIVFYIIPLVIVGLFIVLWLATEFPARRRVEGSPQARECRATGGDPIFDDNDQFLFCYR
ncbi:MAG: hypothetical protein A2655_03575 [Candidatus Yanofskybacteria bacterium RIFCSPHIGHO2_01_FULL_43_42]|uniref:Uncharacterized protein n=1 Tax=Candidatus Collierbacteria bacterium RIFCSPHIGHO2_02_FULL_49_10 TaxID=1817723 RepID=A0A1F5EWM5_9BACT|nr:MAG: hypothetical protein A3D09_02180 [Candidatus Collierbacteria bacterium RIFCSPHIGHO2_02_FULL_49_10]OGN03249.1 MAG: hypothetical protein A2655_03575 [Candidatus Yanofskybacteria bacterium RIFCSPHIGHO2_01_FULL_43_42]